MRRALWPVVIFLSLIMVVVAGRRIVSLFSPAAGQVPRFDSAFADHPGLTLAHILPGLVFILLGPFQFRSGLRKRHPALHRWTGRVFLTAAAIVGITALAMSRRMAIGGPIETAATTVFGLLFLYALARAYLAIRARRISEHRRWMIRAYAIGLAVAVVRPIVGVFFATSRLTHLTPHDFFGIAFWIGFLLSLAAAETWIRHNPLRS